MTSVVHIVTVDRIDEQTAVLVDEDAQVEVPISWIPDGVAEGDVLRCSLERDPEAGAELEERLAGVLGRLKAKSDAEDDGGTLDL